MTHETRREQKYFEDLQSRKMNFLPAKGDKNIQVGDELIIKESLPGEWEKDGHYQPTSSEKLSGREIRRRGHLYIRGRQAWDRAGACGVWIGESESGRLMSRNVNI